jgi:hypothetical protein
MKRDASDRRPPPGAPTTAAADDDPELANILAAFHRPPRPPAPLAEGPAAAPRSDGPAGAKGKPARALSPEERRQGALLALSKLAAEQAPAEPEPPRRDAPTFVLPHAQERKRQRAVLAVAVVVGGTAVAWMVAAAGWPRGQATPSSPSHPAALSSVSPPQSLPQSSPAAQPGGGAPVEPPSAAPLSKPQFPGNPQPAGAPSQRPSGARPLGDRPVPKAKLDPEYKESM